MSDNKSSIQMIYGVALILVGVGLFFRVSQIMPKVEQIEQFSSMTIFIRICFYLVGIILIGGGARKLYKIYSKPENGKQADG